MPSARGNLRFGAQMRSKAWPYFWQLFDYIHVFYFKYISTAHMSTRLCCKPTDKYTYCTKIHVLTQGLPSLVC